MEKKEECPICTNIKKACEKLGDRKICEDAIQDVKEGKISAEQMIDKIEDNFGPDKFRAEFDKSLEEEGESSGEEKDP